MRREDSERRRALLAALVLICLAQPAAAALGGRAGDLEADRRRLSARMSASVRPNWTVHTLALPNGGDVREFARADGMVFAVSWTGPGKPDLRALLGSGFDVMQSDNPMNGRRRLRRALTVNRPDLAIWNGGHPGAFRGAAVLRQAAPAGFGPSAFE